MINQIAPVAAKTAALPQLNKGLMQARHIQAQVKQGLTGRLPTQVHLWSPITAGPYLVPVTVTRWIE
jgi:hypothetical protein